MKIHLPNEIINIILSYKERPLHYKIMKELIDKHNEFINQYYNEFINQYFIKYKYWIRYSFKSWVFKRRMSRITRNKLILFVRPRPRNVTTNMYIKTTNTQYKFISN
jgi:hypothetical protein